MHKRQSRVLVNTLPCISGGGIQVCIAFVKQSVLVEDIDFCYLLSSQVYEQLLCTNDLPDHYVIAKRSSLGRFLHNYFLIYAALKMFKPDLIFTVFGPAYYPFRGQPHLCGYAVPWDFLSEFPYIPGLSMWKKVSLIIFGFLRRRFLDPSSTYWVETQSFKNNILKNRRFQQTAVKVVPNTLNPLHKASANQNQMSCNLTDKFNILLLAAPHIHKSITLLPRVIYCLNSLGFGDKCSFSISISTCGKSPEEIKFWKLVKYYNCKDQVLPLGQVNVSNLSSIYEDSDLVFCPSVLEVFSITPLESFFYSKPVVAARIESNLSVYGDSVHYFEPNNAMSAALAISFVLSNYYYRKDLVQRSRAFLKTHPTHAEAFKMHIDNIRDCIFTS